MAYDGALSFPESGGLTGRGPHQSSSGEGPWIPAIAPIQTPQPTVLRHARPADPFRSRPPPSIRTTRAIGGVSSAVRSGTSAAVMRRAAAPASGARSSAHGASSANSSPRWTGQLFAPNKKPRLASLATMLPVAKQPRTTALRSHRTAATSPTSRTALVHGRSTCSPFPTGAADTRRR